MRECCCAGAWVHLRALAHLAGLTSLQVGAHAWISECCCAGAWVHLNALAHLAGLASF